MDAVIRIEACILIIFRSFGCLGNVDVPSPNILISLMMMVVMMSFPIRCADDGLERPLIDAQNKSDLPTSFRDVICG